MKPRDLSTPAVRKAVLATTAQHPRLGVSAGPRAARGRRGSGFRGPACSPWGRSPAGVGAGVGGWAYQYFRRGDDHARRLLSDFQSGLEKERRDTLEQLRGELDEIDDATGRRQLAQLEQKYTNFQDILQRQLNSGELTYQRYLAIAEQVFLAGLDNLKSACLAQRSVSAIDPQAIASRLEKAGADRPALEKRLALRERQLREVERLYAQNDNAMTHLDHVSTKIASIKTHAGHASVDLESAMSELRVLISRAEQYSRE